MENFEEKIIDLVDVIAEPDPARLKPDTPAAVSAEETQSVDLGKKPDEFEGMVRREVETMLRTMIGDQIQAMIKDILTQEVEKAIAREISGLKKA
jgi:hypothetical protein